MIQEKRKLKIIAIAITFIGAVAPLTLQKSSHLLTLLSPFLANYASVNGLTDSAFVQYGAHYSSHLHPWRKADSFLQTT